LRDIAESIFFTASSIKTKQNQTNERHVPFVSFRIKQNNNRIMQNTSFFAIYQSKKSEMNQKIRKIQQLKNMNRLVLVYRIIAGGLQSNG
jgi:hypothetical protein